MKKMLLAAFAALLIGSALSPVHAQEVPQPIAMAIGQGSQGEVFAFGRDFTLAEAKNKALKFCAEDGDRCKIVATSTKGCIYAWPSTNVRTHRKVVPWGFSEDEARLKVKGARGFIWPDEPGMNYTCTSEEEDN